ncbi:MAG: HAD family hydrolase [Ignavibacteria bacterium]|nr:HAD family hydrolase [Ignavibacteria bacterium]
MKKKAIFFDRDGVVNYRLIGEYVECIDEFHFIPDFFSLFSYLKERGFLAILVTNQQGIGKKTMSLEQLEEIHDYMQKVLRAETGFSFDDLLFCPELSSANSFRRKPNPGMILEAIEKWGIDPKESWLVGDRESDVIAGKRAGVSTALANCLVKENETEADFLAKNLKEVLDFFKKNNI